MTDLVQASDAESPEATGGSHDHQSDSGQTSNHEQTAIYCVAVLGLACNLLLIGLILGQRHTRRLTSAFLVHSACLNLLMSCLTIAFGRGLGHDGISSSSCRSLTVAYIVFQTVWVFNLIPTICCEIYNLDGGNGRPVGSFGCAAFGFCLVYICSAILHLGPTLIGSNFEWNAKSARCLFLHGHAKNYTVYLMWIVIVTVAVGAAVYFLVIFRRAIDRSMRCRLGQGNLATVALVNSNALLASRLGDLAGLKTNRQRVLCGICGIFVACWYPLYLLVLSDPAYNASVTLYHLFTILGFAKTIVEPLAVATCDRTVGRTTMRLLPCTRMLRYVSESEIDARLAAAAAASCPERSDSTSAIASGSSTGGSLAPASVHQLQQQHLQSPRLASGLLDFEAL